MLSEIQTLSQHYLATTHVAYRRYFIQSNPFKTRFSILLGHRGVGKTTTLAQYLLDQSNGDRMSDKILYVPADHFLIANTSLYEIADMFQKAGGKTVVFDEIHKYSNWSQELKSIYDTFTDLTILASGSSALEIHKGSHDLSRRAIVHRMQGLSFREFLELTLNTSFDTYTLSEIMTKHTRISAALITEIEKFSQKVLPLFKKYLQTGYYPFFLETNDSETYYTILEQNLHTTLESDLVSIYPSMTGNSIKKIKALLSYIANSVPFTPNWKKIKTLLEIGDERTLKTYFKYLEDAEVITMIGKATDKLNRLESPEKVYLNNPNQFYALSMGKVNNSVGSIREVFFLNMLSQKHHLTIPNQGDFLVNKDYTFEVGGKNKKQNQIKSLENAFIVRDDTETCAGNIIPLWLFGFLY